MNKTFERISDQVEGLNYLWNAYGVDNSDVDNCIMGGMMTFFNLPNRADKDEQAQEIEEELSRLTRNIGELVNIMEDYESDIEVILAYRDNIPLVTNLHDLVYIHEIKDIKEVNNQIIITIL